MKIRERALCALGKQAEQAFRQILPGESFMNPLSFTFLYLGLPSGSDGKNLPALWETCIQSLGQEDSLEKGMATHFRILAWRILWTEEPGGLQSTGSHRVG